MGASILLPGGFFLGGIVFYGGDSGLGALLVPPGAALLLIALFVLARLSTSPPETAGRGKSPGPRSEAQRSRRS